MLTWRDAYTLSGSLFYKKEDDWLIGIRAQWDQTLECDKKPKLAPDGRGDDNAYLRRTPFGQDVRTGEGKQQLTANLTHCMFGFSIGELTDELRPFTISIKAGLD